MTPGGESGAGGVQLVLGEGRPITDMIDEFVYNPATGTGKLTASVARLAGWV